MNISNESSDRLNVCLFARRFAMGRFGQKPSIWAGCRILRDKTYPALLGLSVGAGRAGR
jgi:hypothetical protein